MNNKTPKAKSPYAAGQWECSKPLHIKEWAIKKLKDGNSPNKVSQDI